MFHGRGVLMYKISNRGINALYEKLSNIAPLFLPVNQDEPALTDFTKWEPSIPAETVDMKTLKTTKSPKDFFLPPFEELYKARLNGEDIEIKQMPLPDKPFILFGVRACDFAGIGLLDEVYLADPVDSFYAARRNSATIFTLACESPAPTCFCNSFDIDPLNPMGDVSMWFTEEFLYLKPITEKGEQVLDSVGSLPEESRPNIPFSHNPNPKLPLERLDPKELLAKFESGKWDQLHQTCISCGTCTFLCPTCQCYDISDFASGKGVRCHRTWDSCMYKDFTLMAHGNPRPSSKARFRQRFMHKLFYYGDSKEIKFGCVGCGRCTNKCPVNLSIVKIIKAMGEE